MPVAMDPDRFEKLVGDAVDEIPDDLFSKIDNCIWMVEDEPGDPDRDLLGFYDGIPLSERTSSYGVVAPDRIVIYRGPHLRMCVDEDDLIEEVRVTVWHEIAHYFGIDDDELDEWGYA